MASYRFVSDAAEPGPTVPTDAAPKTITWIVTPFTAGSGGHINTFRFVGLLEKYGFRSRIVVIDGRYFGGVTGLKKLLFDSFEKLDVPVHIELADAPVSAITVATSWTSAYALRNYRASTRRAYFVQDFEPWFHPHGSDYELANNTYKFGFHGLTAGSWLKEKLSTEYGMDCSSFSFSYDREIYRAGERPKHCGKRIFFYARPSTFRRAFELGMLILDGVAKRVPGLTVVFAGEDLAAYNIPFAHESHGSVNTHALPQLYRQCDLALVLSLTNVSLLPVEIMACGTPVVSNAGPWVEWLLPRESCGIEETEPQKLIDLITGLILDDERLQRLAVSGLEFAQSTSWEIEARKLAAHFERIGGTA